MTCAEPRFLCFLQQMACQKQGDWIAVFRVFISLVLSQKCVYTHNMDKPEIVFNYLTGITPQAVCDDCLAAAAGISPRQQVNVIARAFGLTTDFERGDGICSVCHGDKLVTRALRYKAVF